MEPQDLIAAVASWAEEVDEILAVALCGSYATGMARPDSDVDLVLICTNRERFLLDPSWARHFGLVLSVTFESYGLVKSVRVIYENGLEVEFGMTTLDWVTLPIDEGTAGVMRNGLRVLYDPSGRLAHAVKHAESARED